MVAANYCVNHQLRMVTKNHQLRMVTKNRNILQTVSDECSNAKRQKCESNPLYDILRKDIDAYLGEEWPQWRGGG